MNEEPLVLGTYFTEGGKQLYLNGYNEAEKEYHIIKGTSSQNPFGNEDHAWLTRDEIQDYYGTITHINDLKKP